MLLWAALTYTASAVWRPWYRRTNDLERLSARMVQQHDGLSADNLGNALYAEVPNASFFRPEPGRNVGLAITMQFCLAQGCSRVGRGRNVSDR